MPRAINVYFDDAEKEYLERVQAKTGLSQRELILRSVEIAFGK